jgi:hypothetical protein
LEPPATIYAARSRRFAAERNRLSRSWSRVADLRLVALIGALAALGAGIWLWSPVLGAIALLLGICFGVLVRWQVVLGRARRRFDGLWRINEEAGKRLHREWDALPLRHRLRAEPGHPFAEDLDLFGRASLLHLLEPFATRLGEQTAAGWLLEPASLEAVARRQAAVAELAPLLDLRQELILRGLDAGPAQPDLEPFFAWVEGDAWLARRRALLWAARVSPPLLLALAAAQVTGLIPYPLWVVPAAVNLVLSLTRARPINRILSWTWEQRQALRAFERLLGLLRGACFSSEELRRIQATLSSGEQSAERSIKRLDRLLRFVAPNSAPAYALVQALSLWDVQLLWLLERWQARSGRFARGWLAALGEVEALASLAGLAHDNPDWAFPRLDPAADRFEARALGHPLLPPDVRVANDVTVGPSGSFLLVTGSNMSGKSTLLRTIGVNVVLAGAGAPVCAAALRLPPVHLWTSMRLRDSLERGVSYFMAELRRLKQVVDAAGAGREAGVPLLYLLDEILQGTNTAERQIAARRIVLYLVAQGAIGAVSTHDLTLAASPEMAAVAHPIHFTETILEGGDGPGMAFDYRLRPGVATSTNALRLMRIVGLRLGEEA